MGGDVDRQRLMQRLGDKWLGRDRLGTWLERIAGFLATPLLATIAIATLVTLFVPDFVVKAIASGIFGKVGTDLVDVCFALSNSTMSEADGQTVVSMATTYYEYAKYLVATIVSFACARGLLNAYGRVAATYPDHYFLRDITDYLSEGEFEKAARCLLFGKGSSTLIATGQLKLYKISLTLAQWIVLSWLWVTVGPAACRKRSCRQAANEGVLLLAWVILSASVLLQTVDLTRWLFKVLRMFRAASGPRFSCNSQSCAACRAFLRAIKFGGCCMLKAVAVEIGPDVADSLAQALRSQIPGVEKGCHLFDASSVAVALGGKFGNSVESSQAETIADGHEAEVNKVKADQNV